MSVAKAADVLGVHVNTVHKAIARGSITVVGRRRRRGRYALELDAADVRRLAAARAVMYPDRVPGRKRPDPGNSDASPPTVRRRASTSTPGGNLDASTTGRRSGRPRPAPDNRGGSS